MKAAKTRREKGFAIVLTTLALTSTLLIAGLGFDVGTLYLIRTKLQGAMDAAALATVRALAQNPSTTAAQTVGEEFLTANFPNGYWGARPLASMPISSAVAVSEIDANGNPGTPGTTATAKLVTVTAGVTAPLYFLRILGQQTATISFTSQATRQGVLVMMVLDASWSMQNNSFAGQTACTWAQQDAQAFLGYPQFDPDIDRIGAVAFGDNTYTSPPIANFQSPAGTVNTASQVYTDLNTFAGAGHNCFANTNTSEGLQQGYQAIKNFWAGAAPSRANVIILMTDGAPNGFSANWSTAPLVAGSLCGAPAGGSLTGFTGRSSPYELGIISLAPIPASKMNFSNNPPIIADNGNCKFDTSGTNAYYQDFTTVPATDAYGDALYGANVYLPGISSLMPTDPNTASTSNNPPIGNGSTTTETQFAALSRNAVDGTATRIRADATYRISIYCIGLFGNVAASDPYDIVDVTLLNRIANTPASTIYDPTQPVGAYFAAPDATQLAQAFSQVATAIVARLSK
jgi:Flp pilus assembly protein TadG